jgi:hypothetical protein
MQKLIKFLFVAFISFFMSIAYAMQTWMLVGSQFTGGTWYCTYQLSGSNPPIVQTITNPMGCQGVIIR